MTKDEFEIIVRGSIKESIEKASLVLNKELPYNDIKLISGSDFLADNMEQAVAYIVDAMFVSEDKIKPCADLIIDSFTNQYTVINLFIAKHKPVPFGLNWTGGVGPFIKDINTNLIKNNVC